MASYTAGDQINRALRMLGVLAEGELPSASESADALVAFNQMIDSWSIENLSVYTTLTQDLPWVAGTQFATIGPTGGLGGIRPANISEATYFSDAATGLDYPVTVINQEQYNSIPLKTTTSMVPTVVYLEMSEPSATLHVYPVPTITLHLNLVSMLPLAEADLVTPLVFPQGYMRAFAYNLALEIAPEFGVEPSKDVRRIAMESKRDIKRLNDPNGVMLMPTAILPNKTGFNPYSGN